MKTSLLNHLDPAYSRVLEKRDITAYLEQLSTDAIKWWFNLDVPRIAMHFAPLQALPEIHNQMPLRLVFISRILMEEITSESIIEFHRLFQESNDPDAAVLAVGVAYQRTLDKGSDFSEFTQWQQCAERLLQKESGASPLARAFLLGLMGNAAIVADGDSILAEALFARQLAQIETSGSISLRVFHAAFRAYVFFYRGDLSSAWILFEDILPLSGDIDCSLISRLYLQATYGFYHVLSGDLEMAQQILDKAVKHPLFDQLPLSIWLLIQSNRLFAYAYSGDKEQADVIASQIRARSVPEHNAFFQAYLHYSLGVVALVHQEYRKACIHVEESVLQGKKCHSQFALLMSALLEAQIQAAMGKKGVAFSLLEKWLQHWEVKGFTVLASTGALEIADILASQGRVAQAREYFQKAKDYLPEDEPLQAVPRSGDFLQQLNLRLFSADDQTALDWKKYPIRIQTLGEFKVEIGDHILYDRQWHGGRTRLLLKLLIVHGGYKVSAGNLTDLLWPDADGDKACQNLKATLWRLRRLGLEKNEEPLSWIRLETGQLSLVRSLCIVDAVTFERQIKSLLINAAANIDELIRALELYQGDFLTTDVSETLIIEHRERLRQLFLNAVIHLSEIADSDELMERALDFLIRARVMDHMHEKIHERIMRLYLKLGFPAEALQSYQYAEKMLRQELGIKPGPVLTSLANHIRAEFHS